jgi:hypothetical protein
MRTIYQITTQEFTVITNRIIPAPLDEPNPFTPYEDDDDEEDDD